jgi:ribonuclease E
LPHAGVPGAEQPDLIPAYAGPTPADPYGGQVFDIFDVMEQAELNAAPARRPPAGRRDAPRNRPRWQPPAWAVASFPPMLVPEPSASDRPDRGPPVETWALPSRPFMLRRDRHAPRWSRQPGGARTPAIPAAEVAEPLAHATPEPVERQHRSVPIEAGPPPMLELVPMMEASTVESPVSAQAELALTAETPIVVETPVVAETPVSVEPSEPVAAVTPEPVVVEEPKPQPIPANDAAPGPIIQPIVIGSASSPPVERKRGWWRRL